MDKIPNFCNHKCDSWHDGADQFWTVSERNIPACCRCGHSYRGNRNEPKRIQKEYCNLIEFIGNFGLLLTIGMVYKYEFNSQ